MQREALAPQRAVEGFDECIVHRLARSAELERQGGQSRDPLNPALLSPVPGQRGPPAARVIAYNLGNLLRWLALVEKWIGPGNARSDCEVPSRQSLPDREQTAALHVQNSLSRRLAGTSDGSSLDPQRHPTLGTRSPHRGRAGDQGHAASTKAARSPPRLSLGPLAGGRQRRQEHRAHE